jgi:hypothetical protein
MINTNLETIMRNEKIALITTILLMVCFCTTVSAQDHKIMDPLQEQVPLAEFGPGGSFEPFFMGQPLSKNFYTTFRGKSVANGMNYTALIQSPFAPKSTLGSEAKDALDNGPLLILHNEWDRPNNVVVSLAKARGNQVMNFVVSLPEMGHHVVSLAGYDSFDDVYLISSEAFRAVLQGPGENAATDIEIFHPKNAIDPRTSCAFCTEGYITIGLENYAGGGALTAYVKRYESSTPSEWVINVDYPNIGDTFHDEGGSSTFTSPACKLHTASTHNGSKSHHWRHESSPYSLDDVLFDHSQDGYAYCTSGCSDEFLFYRLYSSGCTP